MCRGRKGQGRILYGLGWGGGVGGGWWVVG